MAKLADIDSEIRMGLKLLGGALFVVVILFLFFKGGAILKTVLFPTPPAPPEVKFGQIPNIKVTPSNTKITYNINTETGTLHDFGDRIKIYKIRKDEPNLVALGNVRDKLNSVGFNLNETKIGESYYQWNNDSGDILRYNLLTNNFDISSSFLTDPPPTGLSGQTTTKEGAYSAAANFLQNIGENIDDIEPTYAGITYLKFENGQLVAATNQNDAQFVQLDLYQKNVDTDFQIFYPRQGRSIMSFIFRNEDDTPRIVKANFQHFIINPAESSTYPIKATQTAFEDLQKGNAIISNPGNSTSVDITNVTIGYYLDESDQEYLLPVIVFSGKNFVAYVPAIP